MGRVKENIRITGKSCWSLFDSGSRNCYVLPEVARPFPKLKLPVPFKVALGGEKHRFKEQVLLYALIQGKPVHFKAYIIDRLGSDEQGKRLDVLVGALTMQEWGIELDLKNERLNMTHYPREFIEF